jgi:hypothetical protein
VKMNFSQKKGLVHSVPIKLWEVFKNKVPKT